MIPVAVRTLHDHDVRPNGWYRITNDGQPGTADVTTENQPARGSVASTIENDRSRSENMSCLDERGAYTRDNLDRDIVGLSPEQFHCTKGITLPVQGIGVRPAPASEEVGILFLDVCRIGKHHFTQVTRCRRRVNRLAISLVYQKRQATGMVDMRVRKHDRVDFADGNGKLGVLLPDVQTLSLKQAAIE